MAVWRGFEEYDYWYKPEPNKNVACCVKWKTLFAAATVKKLDS